MKARHLPLAIFTLSLALVAPSALGAEIQNSDVAQQIVAITPGTNVDEVVSAADSWASEQQITQEEALEEMLEQAQLARDENRLASASQAQSPFRSNPFGAKRTLPRSSYKGDIYITDSKVQPFGHTGIFGDTTWTVEAPGIGEVSRWFWHYDKKVVAGAKFVWFKVSQATQNAAADYAYANLLNYPYNTKFFDNKQLNPSHLNCSQLVWLAYKKGAGLDLDGNGGPGVYPRDFLKSSLAHHYYTVP